MHKQEEAGRLGLWQLLGTGSLCACGYSCTSHSTDQPSASQQGTQGVGVAGGSRIVLAVLSTFDGMTGFNNLPLSPANIQVPP